MDATHLHLLLNHFPIIGTMIGTVMLAWAVLRKNPGLRSASFAVIIAMALIAIPVFKTGEPAEESVEHLSDVSENMIEEHEDAATTALIAMEIAGALSLIGVLASRRNHPRTSAIAAVTLAVSVVSCGLMANAGYLGGQIRHSEIRSGSTSAPANEKHDEKDDDDHSELSPAPSSVCCSLHAKPASFQRFESPC